MIHGKYSATLGFMKFFAKHFMKLRVAEYDPWIIYIYIYIYIIISYNSSILDIEHSLYYFALGSTHIYIHIVIHRQTLLLYHNSSV